MDAIVVIVFVVVTFLKWYYVGGLLSTRISPESDYDNLRGVPNGKRAGTVAILEIDNNLSKLLKQSIFDSKTY
ncbi:hypothetical protein DPMN_013618 [Dreissena polymorpha]|uniref:Uncharacterized protein n=1 Tax=Dreissena polymorpha TaxID=45954 RepID=A0A9D4S1Z7_DREPO|nr:hypothetical protein DPMN_013618 [Dreissena polymorpha]